MMASGKIAKWNDEKGFGFIAPDAGGNQVFVHIKAFARGAGRPRIGERVSYELAHDGQGRSRAEKVISMSGPAFPGPVVAACLASCLALAVIATAAFNHFLPFMVLWLYLGMSVLLFVLYALDKSAAGKGDQRIPESNLHAIALVGGWPGALCAQQLFRHKTRKTSFIIVFWITVVANISGLIFLFSPYGRQCFSMMMGMIA